MACPIVKSVSVCACSHIYSRPLHSTHACDVAVLLHCRESERVRIERQNPNPKMPMVRYTGGTWRVGGLLALSRAFGDAYLKVRAESALYCSFGGTAGVQSSSMT
jgi:hypothetical protein